jgi:hypothetical protein
MEHAHTHVAQLVLLAVLHVDVRKAHAGRLVIENGRARDGREAARAGEVVGLDMGLEDVRDAHPLLSGRFEVRLDVGLWIHHSAAGFAPSAEEVAGAAGLGSEELTEDHGRPSFAQTWSHHQR